MSLYESGNSCGEVSLKDLFDGNVKNKIVPKTEFETLADLIVKGGWPESIELNVEEARKITRSYIEAVLDKDISDIDGKNRDKGKMEMLLRSFYRSVFRLCNS